MQILIIAATGLELMPVREFLEKQPEEISSVSVEFLFTGIGMLNTAYHLQRAISKERPSLIIQAGIAGCYYPNNIGEVVIVEEDFPGDLGVYENNRFNSIFDLQLADKNQFPFVNGYLGNPNEKLLSVTNLNRVRAVTVNEITTNPERIQWVKKQSDPFSESMEGAALHYVCLQEELPFLQIRAISNEVGERNKTRWDIKLAVTRLGSAVISLLKQLNSYHETDFRI
jgi:futalosine hydrolase